MDGSSTAMFPEITARSDIEAKLLQACWVVQDHKRLCLTAKPGHSPAEGAIDFSRSRSAEVDSDFVLVERRLSVVDELDATITANLRRATRLRQSVLANAFSNG